MKGPKLTLLDALAQNPDPSAVRRTFSVAGVGFTFFLHGDGKFKISTFMDSYFEAFPAETVESKVIIHYFTSVEDSPNNLATHEFWNEDLEDFNVSSDSGRRVIHQRDFIAYEAPENVFYATGPVLDEGCCDSTDNLVQYALGRHLISNGILPLHAATFVAEGKAYVFFGESGAGKSTLALQAMNLEKFHIMSGDQIFLTMKDGRVHAQANTTKIFGFERNHPAWLSGPYPVRALLHLKKEPRSYEFQKKTFQQQLPFLLSETVAWKEAIEPEELLDLVLKIGEDPKVTWGDFTYRKDHTFWHKFQEDLDGRE